MPHTPCAADVTLPVSRGRRRLPRRFLATILAIALAALLLPAAGAQAKGLPKPHVSPSLDAVLMPITAEVRKEFRLGKKAAGAVVVSVDPGGTAELYGLEPGDVITQLDGKVIRRPVDIDSMVKHQLNQGNSYFFFDGTRKNRKKKTIIEIPAEEYAKPVAVETVPKWRGYNSGGTKAKGKRGKGGRGQDGAFVTGGGGFFYADFCDAYAPDFYEIYDYTLVYVEEVIVTEVWITAYESDETVFWYDETLTGWDWPDEDYIAEVDDYVYSDAFFAEYAETEIIYEDDSAYDPETGLSWDEAAELGIDLAAQEGGLGEFATEEPAYDDPAAFDDPAAEEPVYDEPVTDEPVYDEPVYDEPVTEEPVFDEPVYDEPVADEPVYDEPVYDEPVAEEPVYDEPVYDEPIVEEPVFDEPVYDEPVYDEPIYDEPVYDEPVYDEPVYDDGGGGGCYYDEDGNEICG